MIFFVALPLVIERISGHSEQSDVYEISTTAQNCYKKNLYNSRGTSRTNNSVIKSIYTKFANTHTCARITISTFFYIYFAMWSRCVIFYIRRYTKFSEIRKQLQGNICFYYYCNTIVIYCHITVTFRLPADSKFALKVGESLYSLLISFLLFFYLIYNYLATALIIATGAK